VNRTAHQELVKALSGRGGGAVGVSNGEVTLDLTPFVTLVKQDLASRGLAIIDKVPTPHVTLALFPSRYLEKAQTAYRLLNDLKTALPIVALLLLALGVYIARGHRRALIAAGAFLTGPSVTAVRIRGTFSVAFGWVRRSGETYGITTGPVGRWAYAHRAALRTGAVALAAIVFVFWGRPTAVVVVLIAVLLLMVLGLIELIGRPPQPQPLAASDSRRGSPRADDVPRPPGGQARPGDD
jgi:hypothetical protein